jgi:hypothetical protein
MNMTITYGMAQIKGDGQCPICSLAFDADRVIALNASAEQVAAVRETLRARKENGKRD